MLYFHCYKNGQLQAITPDSILAGAFASGQVGDDKTVVYTDETGRVLTFEEAQAEKPYVKFCYWSTQHRKLGSGHASRLDWRDNIEGYWSR